MNLGQAYQGWQQMQENHELYMKTREAFRKAWFTLPTNKPCSYYTKDVLGQALAATREIESNKVNAASVMCHVLAFANWAEPKFNPKPDFTYQDLMEYTRGPSANPEKIASIPVEDKDDTDLDIDPVTAQPRTQKEGRKPDICDGCNNVKGCITCVNGDQWARITEVETKKEEDMEYKKQRGKPKPVAQIDPKTLQVVKVWPSMTEVNRKLGARNLGRCMQMLSKSAGYYWSFAEEVDTFKERLEAKTKASVEKTTAGVKADPKPVVEQQPHNAAHDALEVFTDDELLEELDRRGWHGELRRTQVVSIGN